MEVLRSLRARPATAALPVLVLTSMGDDLATRAGFEGGASDYLVKPFTMPQLAARVRICLARTSESPPSPAAERDVNP